MKSKNALVTGLSVLTLCGCASVHMNLVNTRATAVRHVEIKIDDKVTTLPELAPGAVNSSDIKVQKTSGITVNFLDDAGHQFYTSAPLVLKPADGGWVQLSITARGTLDATDGRKK